MTNVKTKWNVPVVDFTAWSLDNNGDNYNKSESASETKRSVAKHLVQALEGYGVVYLINHGIHFDKLNRLRDVCRRFFDLPNEVKLLSMRPRDDVSNGWVGKGMEYAGGISGHGDFKEAVSFHVPGGMDFTWPDDLVPDFREVNLDFNTDCMNLGKHIVKILQIVLESNTKEEDSVFARCHTKLGTSANGNSTQGRSLIYPPMTDQDLLCYDVRLAEHTDWGTITFLFQDDTGGLEVRDKQGVWHDAVPMEGAILVQAADQLERWTSGRIRSMPHRVIVRSDNRHKTRESTVFFLTPDNDCLVSCLDGSDTYPPCIYGDYGRMSLRNIQADDESTKEKALS